MAYTGSPLTAEEIIPISWMDSSGEADGGGAGGLGVSLTRTVTTGGVVSDGLEAVTDTAVEYRKRFRRTGPSPGVDRFSGGAKSHQAACRMSSGRVKLAGDGWAGSRTTGKITRTQP
jgi:hypothetical protein